MLLLLLPEFLCRTVEKMLVVFPLDEVGMSGGGNSSPIVLQMSRLMLAKAEAAKGSLRLFELSNRACAIEELKSSKGDDLPVSSDTSTSALLLEERLCSSVLGGGVGGLSSSNLSHWLSSSSLLLHVEITDSVSVS